MKRCFTETTNCKMLYIKSDINLKLLCFIGHTDLAVSKHACGIICGSYLFATQVKFRKRSRFDNVWKHVSFLCSWDKTKL